MSVGNNKFHKVYKSNVSSSSSGSTTSIIYTVVWSLLLIWLLLLFYSWETGFFTKDKISKVVHEVDLIINRTEQTLLRGHHLNKIHVAIPFETLPAQTAIGKHRKVSDPGEVHVIFSTDCAPYQDWQTIVLFHSAQLVDQKGPVTRIASGCDESKKKELVELYKILYPDYFVHFTPDFKKDEKSQQSYDFYNKPWGLKHWLENASPPVQKDAIIALVDPDMILIRPLTPEIRNLPSVIIDKKIPDSEIFDRVSLGHPAAQIYGLGAPWANDNHKYFKRIKICGAGSPCLDPSVDYGEMHYSVGPPYLVHRDDMIRIAKSWTEFVPRVYEGYPFLLAEMYAYSMAAAHERLPHLQLWNHMVSNIDSFDEGWKWVDALTEVCEDPVDGVFYPGTPLPTVVHYCQTYRAGELGFMKRIMKKNIFTCEGPLFIEPAKGTSQLDYIMKHGEKLSAKPRHIKRNAFQISIITRVINLALIDYKKKICENQKGIENINYQKTQNMNLFA